MPAAAAVRLGVVSAEATKQGILVRRQLCICITQPRRVAAVSLARRVAEEMGSQELVGYQVGSLSFFKCFFLARLLWYAAAASPARACAYIGSFLSCCFCWEVTSCVINAAAKLNLVYLLNVHKETVAETTEEVQGLTKTAKLWRPPGLLPHCVLPLQVRHDKHNVGPRCRLKFATDGVLLREIQEDFLLR